jgi:hypothetical protein
MKKTEGQKSRDTVPLSAHFFISVNLLEKNFLVGGELEIFTTQLRPI